MFVKECRTQMCYVNTGSRFILVSLLRIPIYTVIALIYYLLCKESQILFFPILQANKREREKEEGERMREREKDWKSIIFRERFFYKTVWLRFSPSLSVKY